MVIGSNGGLAALVRALQTFSSNALVQEYTGTALARLCAQSEGNQRAVVVQQQPDCCVVSLLVQAMRTYSQSVAVVSAAIEALSVLGPCWLLLTRTNDNTDASMMMMKIQDNMVEVLRHAQQMYLHPTHKHMIEELLLVVFSSTVDNNDTAMVQ